MEPSLRAGPASIIQGGPPAVISWFITQLTISTPTGSHPCCKPMAQLVRGRPLRGLARQLLGLHLCSAVPLLGDSDGSNAPKPEKDRQLARKLGRFSVLRIDCRRSITR